MSAGPVGKYEQRPLDELVERAERAAAGEPMVFFIGAGASAPAPSFMPQPWLIQKAVYDCVAPQGAEHEELITKSLPEIYHEVLLDLGGEVTREIWQVLKYWESPTQAPQLAQFGLGPNIVHYLVVYLSWKARTPVVTVNFDRMLERAAANLGLRPDVDLEAVTGPESVAIWKLHGTVDDPPSIRTTLQGITATDQLVLERVENQFARGGACLIGYSGHDIDFFPFLCSWDLPEQTYWLDLDLSKTTIGRYPDPFLGVEAPAQEWAQKVIERLPEGGPLVSRLRQEAERPAPPRGPIAAAYEDLVRAQAKRTYENAFPPGSPKRVLAQAMILAALGRNVDADAWADRYLAQARGQDAAQDCRAYLLKSAMAHEFARYEDSRRYAETARSLAREAGLRPEADQATLRIDEANRMLHVPPRLPFTKAWHLLRPESLWAVLGMTVDAMRLRRRGRVSSRGGAPPYAELRATFEYLEHLIRLGAIVQGGLERILPAATVSQLCDWYWSWLESRSYKAGYASGIGNSKKYRLRRRSSTSSGDPFSVRDLYSMAPSPTGLCIHLRDVAEELTAKLQATSPGAAREELEEEVVQRFEEAIKAAREAGDPSLELKAMLGLNKGTGRTRPRESVEKLLSQIQSPAFARYTNEVMRSLAP
ncbi:MAG TPA: SIR2 family protein [Solirubrobacterales bacterium]|nr:SIR2 family protein [Solirubrobacterales bacterium]